MKCLIDEQKEDEKGGSKRKRIGQRIFILNQERT